MKRLNFKHIIMGLAASSCLAFSSCPICLKLFMMS